MVKLTKHLFLYENFKIIFFVAGVTLKMPVLNVTGALSPHIDDTVTFNGRLEPTKTNWLKVSCIFR